MQEIQKHNSLESNPGIQLELAINIAIYSNGLQRVRKIIIRYDMNNE